MGLARGIDLVQRGRALATEQIAVVVVDVGMLDHDLVALLQRRWQRREARQRTLELRLRRLQFARLMPQLGLARLQARIEQAQRLELWPHSAQARQQGRGGVVTARGAFQVGDVRAIGIALQVADLQVGGSEVGEQRGVVAGLALQRFEVGQRIGHQPLLHRQRTGELADAFLVVEQHGVGEAVHVLEATLGARTLLGRNARLPQGRGSGRKQQHQADAERGHRDAMAPDEAAQHVARACATCGYRTAGEHRTHVRSQLTRRCVTPLRLFLQRHRDDAVQIDAPGLRHCDQPGLAQQRRRVFVQQCLAQGLVTAPIATERVRVAQQLEQQQPERMHIGRGGDRFAAQLLRGGVGRGQRWTEVARQRAVAPLADQLADAVVEQLGRAGVGDHDVAGLDVAMHQQALVRVGDGVADVREQRKARRHRGFAAAR